MSRPVTPEPARLYTPAEVAAIFHVGTRTVARWAETGKLPSATRTPGGHRRYDAGKVDALLRGEQP